MKNKLKIVIFVLVIGVGAGVLSSMADRLVPAAAASASGEKYEVIVPRGYAFDIPSNRGECLRKLEQGDIVTLLKSGPPHWLQIEIDTQTPEAFMDEMELHKINEPLEMENVEAILPLIAGGQYF